MERIITNLSLHVYTTPGKYSTQERPTNRKARPRSLQRPVKRSVALVALAFFLTGILPLPAQAQLGEGIDIKPGVRAGMDFMTLGGQDAADDNKRRTGFMIGGFVLVDAGLVAVQPELMYIQKGASQEGTFNGTTITRTTKLDYIEVPFLVKLQAPLEEGITPSVFAGPTLGLNVTAKREAEGESLPQDISGDISDRVSGTDFGLALGGGVDIDFSAGTLMGDIRYGLGLTRVYDGDASIQNRGFMITAGLALDLSSLIQP